MINNEIRDWHGDLKGFKCTNCGRTYQSGWGSECNSCRTDKEENAKLRGEIRRLRQAIEK